METNQPGFLGLTSSRIRYGLIKVVMAPKIAEKQAKPDQGEKATIKVV